MTLPSSSGGGPAVAAVDVPCVPRAAVWPLCLWSRHRHCGRVPDHRIRCAIGCDGLADRL